MPWRYILLVSIIFASFGAVLFIEPIPQPLSYHNFADQNDFLGLPNFLNVISNLALLIVGLIGLIYCLKNRQEKAPWSWRLFFAGVVLTGIGSAYYHLDPQNLTLIWDRLPISITFTSLLIGVLSLYISPKIERYFLTIAVLLGISCTFYWHNFDDLRFYVWMQAITFFLIILTLLLFKGPYKKYFFLALISYILAVTSEVTDAIIFSFTHQQISGHTLKHLFAALSCFWIYLMLRKTQRRIN